MTSTELKLDEHNQETWQAYSDMFKSKQAHYEFLELLENKKKKFNLGPTEEEQKKLEGLLAQHDTNVKRFTQLSVALKSSHPDSHTALFQLIAEAGDGLPDPDNRH